MGNKIKDRSGIRFGRLIAKCIDRQEKHLVYWKCLCDCGKTTIVLSSSLGNGHTQSCGCLMRDRSRESCIRRGHLGEGESSFKGLYHNYSYAARRRNLAFELAREDAKELFTSRCYYCGEKPKQVHTVSHANGSFIYNGIDRLDNAIGYIKSNCVSCCGKCNRAKLTMSIGEFKEWVKKVYENIYINCGEKVWK